jgi:hypothetical protein
MKLLLQFYALPICFTILICGSIAAYAIIGVIAPELTIATYEYNNYQSNDKYWNSFGTLCRESNGIDAQKAVKPPEEKLTKQRIESLVSALNIERRNNLQTLIQCMIFTLALVITLLTHWKIAKKAKEPLS